MVARSRIYPVSLSLLGVLVVPDLQAETESALTLPATAVNSEYSEQSYMPTESRSALKIDAPLRDIPHTVNVIPQSVLKDPGAQSMADVLKNVPGIGLFNGEGQR